MTVASGNMLGKMTGVSGVWQAVEGRSESGNSLTLAAQVYDFTVGAIQLVTTATGITSAGKTAFAPKAPPPATPPVTTTPSTGLPKHTIPRPAVAANVEGGTLGTWFSGMKEYPAGLYSKAASPTAATEAATASKVTVRIAGAADDVPAVRPVPKVTLSADEAASLTKSSKTVAAEVATAEKVAAPNSKNSIDLVVSKSSTTLDLTESGWRSTKFQQEGVVYIVRDGTTGELLKVGQTTSSKFDGRFEKYVTAGNKTGKKITIDVFDVPLDMRGTVEGQIRRHLGG